jgi:ATP-dependent Zn protease
MLENSIKDIKFTKTEKKILSNRIEKLTNIKDSIHIFLLAKSDLGNKYTQNENGIWIYLNELSDSTLYKIDRYIDNITYQEDNSSISILRYNNDDLKDFDNIGPKLSNHEKSLIKKLRLSEQESSCA